MREYLTELVGETILTLTGKPNQILSVSGRSVKVGTLSNETGGPVSIDFVQSVVDRVFDGGDVLLERNRRSAFVGAVLMTFDDVEVLARPIRARLIGSPSETSKAWSDDENRAAVDAYLDMLSRYLSGRAFVKKVLVEQLQAGSLSGRSRRSIESRFQNISFVMESNGLPWVKGYAPLSNVGTEVKARIEKEISKSNTGFLEAYRPTANIEELDNRVERIWTDSLSIPPISYEAPKQKVSESRQFVRNPQVVAWVLKEANGRCESCLEPGPFLSGEKLFLEVHHVLPLSKGGTDSVDNAVAVCPNCHRRCHLSDDWESATDGLYGSVPRLRRL